MEGIKKKLAAVVLATALLCPALTGCGDEPAPADQTVSALFELSVRSNAAPMAELLGFASEADVRSTFFEEGTEPAENIRAQLADAGIEMTEEELSGFTDSMMSMLDRITYTAEITSQDNDTAVVTLKVNGYSADDITDVLTDTADAMTAGITEEDLLAIVSGDTEVFSAYMHQYLQDFLNGFSALEPTAGPAEISVTCEKLIVEVNGQQKIAWLPTDMDSFCADVEAALFQ